jgi:hypothetical protein
VNELGWQLEPSKPLVHLDLDQRLEPTKRFPSSGLSESRSQCMDSGVRRVVRYCTAWSDSSSLTLAK